MGQASLLWVGLLIWGLKQQAAQRVTEDTWLFRAGTVNLCCTGTISGDRCGQGLGAGQRAAGGVGV